MLNENNILEYIKCSNLIEEKLKIKLIEHFDTLPKNQINILIDHFNKQKKEILDILRTLKNKEVCSFEEIKDNLEKINREIIKKNELKEKQEDEENILNLLKELH